MLTNERGTLVCFRPKRLIAQNMWQTHMVGCSSHVYKIWIFHQSHTSQNCSLLFSFSVTTVVLWTVEQVGTQRRLRYFRQDSLVLHECYKDTVYYMRMLETVSRVWHTLWQKLYTHCHHVSLYQDNQTKHFRNLVCRWIILPKVNL